jgi:hypothetical protein
MSNLSAFKGSAGRQSENLPRDLPVNRKILFIFFTGLAVNIFTILYEFHKGPLLEDWKYAISSSAIFIELITLYLFANFDFINLKSVLVGKIALSLLYFHEFVTKWRSTALLSLFIFTNSFLVSALQSEAKKGNKKALSASLLMLNLLDLVYTAKSLMKIVNPSNEKMFTIFSIVLCAMTVIILSIYNLISSNSSQEKSGLLTGLTLTSIVLILTPLNMDIGTPKSGTHNSIHTLLIIFYNLQLIEIGSSSRDDTSHIVSAV